MQAVFAALGIVTAFLFILLFIRVAYLFASTPAGELSGELVYLWISDLRAPGFFLMVALFVRSVELTVPFIDRFAHIRAALPDLEFFLGASETFSLLIAVVLGFFVISRYSHRGFDRRLHAAMEHLAYLAVQRKRRVRDFVVDEDERRFE
ncbi:MAG: hypothetical protein ACYDCK_06005 [Thermoplasmatota archaeon]